MTPKSAMDLINEMKSAFNNMESIAADNLPDADENLLKETQAQMDESVKNFSEATDELVSMLKDPTRRRFLWTGEAIN